MIRAGGIGQGTIAPGASRASLWPCLLRARRWRLLSTVRRNDSLYSALGWARAWASGFGLAGGCPCPEAGGCPRAALPALRMSANNKLAGNHLVDRGRNIWLSMRHLPCDSGARFPSSIGDLTRGWVRDRMRSGPIGSLCESSPYLTLNRYADHKALSGTAEFSLSGGHCPPIRCRWAMPTLQVCPLTLEVRQASPNDTTNLAGQLRSTLLPSRRVPPSQGYSRCHDYDLESERQEPPLRPPYRPDPADPPFRNLPSGQIGGRRIEVQGRQPGKTRVVVSDA
jgi:hypothetical protein